MKIKFIVEVSLLRIVGVSGHWSSTFLLFRRGWVSCTNVKEKVKYKTGESVGFTNKLLRGSGKFEGTNLQMICGTVKVKMTIKGRTTSHRVRLRAKPLRIILLSPSQGRYYPRGVRTPVGYSSHTRDPLSFTSFTSP